MIFVKPILGWFAATLTLMMTLFHQETSDLHRHNDVYKVACSGESYFLQMAPHRNFVWLYGDLAYLDPQLCHVILSSKLAIFKDINLVPIVFCKSENMCIVLHGTLFDIKYTSAASCSVYTVATKCTHITCKIHTKDKCCMWPQETINLSSFWKLDQPE